MGIEKIYSIVGKAGLFEIVSTNKNVVILDSLIDKKRIQAFSSDKLTCLKDISIYTNDEETPLIEIFKSIYKKENGGKCIDSKSDNNALKNYMKEVLPDYNQDKVYVSDMKKLFSWYNLLLSENILDFSKEENSNKENNNDTEESK